MGATGVSRWIHPEAAQEIVAATAYYARNAGRAIAMAFLLEIRRVLDLLEISPLLGAVSVEGMRAYHLNRFPFTVFYTAEAGATLRIYAVMHQRRDPSYWRRRH